MSSQPSVVVAIDTLRMTSVAITALSHGCLGVKPLVEIDEALNFKKNHPDALLGGERKGLLIPGFDLGNSPLEYTEAAVRGRMIAITTSNGTRAIHAARDAGRLLLGALINARAVALVLSDAPDCTLLCAGTGGEVSMEDVLTAGAILHHLDASGRGWRFDDAGLLSLRAYRAACGDLRGALVGTRHYEYLASLGEAQRADLAYCLRKDLLDSVPQWDAGRERFV